MKKCKISRDGIEGHISISLRYMINSAKKLDEQALQSSTKYIKNVARYWAHRHESFRRK